MPPKKSENKSSEASVQPIKIAKIRRDGGTQPRAQIYEEVVAEYAEDMSQGAEFPPVIIFFDGEEYWLADGFHRACAKEAIGEKEVLSKIHSGTQRDAVLYAAGANATHGLRRTNADKRRAVEQLLRDFEWRRWSDNAIAQKCGVSHPFVSKLRAENVGDLSSSDSAVRTVKRGDKTYTVDTTNIGQGSSSQTSKPSKRQRKKKQPTNSPTPTIQSKEVSKGDIWKLGKFHYLFCGDPYSRNFQKLLPSEIGLFLTFLDSEEHWPHSLPINTKNALLFYSSYGEDIDLRNLRQIIENCLTTTTDADDIVVMLNLPDPSLFILMESLYCLCYCADPDPQRCTDALTVWATTKQPARKL